MNRLVEIFKDNERIMDFYMGFACAIFLSIIAMFILGAT